MVWDVTGRFGFYVFLLTNAERLWKNENKICSFLLVFFMSLGVAESYQVVWPAAGYKVQFMCVQIRRGKT